MDAPSEISQSRVLNWLQTPPRLRLRTHDALIAKLQASGVSYQYLVHQPVFTSLEAASVRGIKLAQGAKALVLDADKQYILLVLPGDQQANLVKLQQVLKVKNYGWPARTQSRLRLN
jgi:prolyl-tRNA editing enzyme YbaK/EbsC (Cys-tRNA(Pro) deacylase)